MAGIEDSFLLISRLDIYIVKAPADIQLSNVFGSVELQYEFGDEGQEVLVLYHYRVKSLVVLH